MLSSFNSLSPVILLVLALLLGFSVISWTLLVVKWVQFARTRKANQRFLAWLETTAQGPSVGAEAGVTDSPLAALYRAGQRERDQGLESVSRALRKTSTVEIDQLEKGVSFLATTASTTPFIGLFGTVWGIMNAFQQIGEAGSTSLTIVAPGISEALVTTAIGLAVAIPAVVGYNYLQSRLRKLTNEIDNFSYDYLNTVHRASLGQS